MTYTNTLLLFKFIVIVLMILNVSMMNTIATLRKLLSPILFDCDVFLCVSIVCNLFLKFIEQFIYTHIHSNACYA